MIHGEFLLAQFFMKWILGVPFRSEKSQKFACLQLPIIGVANASKKES